MVNCIDLKQIEFLPETLMTVLQAAVCMCINFYIFALLINYLKLFFFRNKFNLEPKLYTLYNQPTPTHQTLTVKEYDNESAISEIKIFLDDIKMKDNFEENLFVNWLFRMIEMWSNKLIKCSEFTEAYLEVIVLLFLIKTFHVLRRDNSESMDALLKTIKTEINEMSEEFGWFSLIQPVMVDKKNVKGDEEDKDKENVNQEYVIVEKDELLKQLSADACMY